MRCIYSARLVPIGKPVRIPAEDGGTPIVSTFTDKSFEIDRRSKTKPEVWMNHERALRIGHVAMLYTQRDWWCCDFMLDRDVPDDIDFDVGQPVSVGLSQLKIGSRGTFLTEVSIVRHGAVEGAEITRRYEIKETPPAPAKPAPSPVAAAPPRRSADVVEIIYDETPTIWRNHANPEIAEIHRRMDYIERQTGRRADPEAVLLGMQVERDGIVAIHRLAIEHEARRRRNVKAA